MKQKKKRIVLLLNEGLWDKLQELKKERSHDYETETCYWMISEMYDRDIKEPPYIKAKGAKVTPFEREKAKIDAKEMSDQIKKDIETERATNICTQLGGTVERIGGHNYCVYLKYQEQVGAPVQKIRAQEPLSMVDEDLLTYQYTGWKGDQTEETKERLISKMQEQQQNDKTN